MNDEFDDTFVSDNELVSRAINYIFYLSTNRPTFDLSRTILMDETAVFFEDPRLETVDVIGPRHVVLISTGFASMRVTVILTVPAPGKKLLSVAIWKGKGGDKIGARRQLVRGVAKMA